MYYSKDLLIGWIGVFGLVMNEYAVDLVVL